MRHAAEMHVATVTVFAWLLVYYESGTVRVRCDGNAPGPVRRATPSGVMSFLCARLPTAMAVDLPYRLKRKLATDGARAK